MKKIFSILNLLLLLNTSLFSNPKNFNVDHIALATLMIYDGKYDIARDELKLVDPKSPSYDAAKFFTVLGVIDSKEQKYGDAIQNFKSAIEATKNKTFKDPSSQAKEKYLFSLGSSDEKKGDSNPSFDPQKVKTQKLNQLYIYLSQAYYKSKDYKNTVITLDKAGEKGRDRASLYTLRAECYFKIKEYDNSINALNKGQKLFPKEYSLMKQKFYYLAKLELYQSAIKTAKEYIKLTGNNATEYIALAQLLLNANQSAEAIKVLEEAKLRFPKEAKIGVILAHAYNEKDMQFCAADLYENSAIYDKKYISDAVEMHRRVGNLPHAIYLNSQMKNKTEKLKHKIAIYIDRGEFEKVIGLKKGLKRYNLLADENVRYALAYSYYMAKDYDNAETHLKKISDSELFNKATVIRKNIEQCRDNAMECI
jgi:tetratricopeptide (TPR) repeat protein